MQREELSRVTKPASNHRNGALHGCIGAVLGQTSTALGVLEDLNDRGGLKAYLVPSTRHILILSSSVPHGASLCSLVYGWSTRLAITTSSLKFDLRRVAPLLLLWGEISYYNVNKVIAYWL